jgi:hypothetical protein
VSVTLEIRTDFSPSTDFGDIFGGDDLFGSDDCAFLEEEDPSDLQVLQKNNRGAVPNPAFVPAVAVQRPPVTAPPSFIFPPMTAPPPFFFRAPPPLAACPPVQLSTAWFTQQGPVPMGIPSSTGTKRGSGFERPKMQIAYCCESATVYHSVTKKQKGQAAGRPRHCVTCQFKKERNK